VTAAFGNTYSYDAVGNQTSRLIAGTAYTQTFDYDNRLTTVAGGSVSASFVYDAAGNRVKGTVAGVTTVYIAGLYEWQNGAVTKYYEGGALRRTGYATDNGVFYVLADHLRSTSVLVKRDGTVKDRNYYYPYGGNRVGGVFSGLTTKRFTGQYHEQGLPGGEGLSYYNARWYDAQVGVFINADTLVPSPFAPQALNRYAYVSGNPLRYVDPSGHAQCRTVEDCADLGETPMGTRPYVPKPPVGVWKPTPQAWSKTPVPATWVWPNGRFNAVQYTRDEMRKNTISPDANGMRYAISDPFILPLAACRRELGLRQV
jgi:RHS repeat-associated protein